MIVMKVWRKTWNTDCIIQPFWANLIIIWITIPLFLELTARLFGIEYFGLVIGLIISSIKTAYDYIQIKYL